MFVYQFIQKTESQVMENIDLYDILKVPRNCSADEMKKSYKKLCIQHHPDKGGDENEFKKVSEAYNILKDPEKRNLYDKYGMEGLKNGMMNHSNDADMQSMMENLFGFKFPFAGSKREGPGNASSQPSQIKLKIKIPLEDVMNGNQNFVYHHKRRVIDKTIKLSPCQVCKGQGFRMMNQQMGFMQMQQQVACPQCQGKRYENLEKAYQTIEERVIVPIQKNCAEGHMFVLKGKMDEVPDQPSGDVILIVEYADHPVFERAGFDLFFTLSLTFAESVIGFMKEIQLLDTSTLRIGYPNMIKWNQILCIQEKGLYNHRTQKYGELYLFFQIDYPDHVKKETLDGLQECVGTRPQISWEPSSMKLMSIHSIPSLPVLQRKSSGQTQPTEQQPSSARHGFPFGGIPGMGTFMHGGGGAPPGQVECHQQ